MNLALRVLVTNIHLEIPAGTETYTRTLAHGLRRLGHDVTVYSPFLGKFARQIRRLGVRVTDKPEALQEEVFDVIHAQHNVLALEVRHLFHRVPMLFHSHGYLPLPEQPPSIDLNIQYFIAISEKVRRNLERQGISRRRIVVMPNPIDVGHFTPTRPISHRPRRALVVSNRIDDETLGVIDEACRRLKIRLEVIGIRSRQVSDVRPHMNRADVVFTLSRGAIEAMACGRAVFVYDYLGADGWVTPESIDELAKSNFDGTRHGRRLTPEDLIEEFSRYDSAMGSANRRMAEERFDINDHLSQLIDLYDRAKRVFRKRPLLVPGREIEVLLEETRNHLRERDRLLTDRAAELAQQKETVSLMDTALTEQHSQLLKRDAVLHEQQAMIAEKDAAIAHRDAANEEKDAAIADKELRLAAALSRHEALTGSIGYRFLERVRAGLRRLAPPGTRRASIVNLFGHAADVLISRGFVQFFLGFMRVWKWIPSLWIRAPVQPRQLPTAPVETLSLDEQYQLWLERQKLTDDRIEELRDEAGLLSYRPKISIVVPVHNTDRLWLEAAIESVRSQIYDNWELCLVDDGSRRMATRGVLRKYRRRDARIRVTRLKQNQGIAAASNAGLALATGVFVGFLDHDDELKPEALFEVVKLLNERRDFDFIYSDEDKRDLEGQLVEPFFKPDWSPDLLMSVNYVNHFSVYRKELLEQLGWFRLGYEGSQDYDLVLRASEITDKIGHIPRPLYSWRKAPGSAAASLDAKRFAYDAGTRALEDALKRRGYNGEVTEGLVPGRYRVKYSIKGKPKVTVIIPTRDRVDMLRRCIESVTAKTTYPNYEIVVVDNESSDEETLEYLRSFDGTVIAYPHSFNYAKIMNTAASQATGDVLLFLNNDTEVITPDWMEAMLEHGQRQEVAAVGARLLYPDGRVQHEGIVIGLVGGSAGNVDHGGFFGMGKTIRNCSAVTGACMLVRPELYWELGGFEERLGVAFNDVDFCLRAREKGYEIVYTPYAFLYHYESATRGSLHPEQDERFFRNRWGTPGEYRDAYYNPNLDPLRPFALRL